jgi:hypothetical protein
MIPQNQHFVKSFLMAQMQNSCIFLLIFFPGKSNLQANGRGLQPCIITIFFDFIVPKILSFLPIDF